MSSACPTRPRAWAVRSPSLLSHAGDIGLARVRPELRLDGYRPTAEQLRRRLAAFWLPDEVVLYLGLAGTSVGMRIAQYYSTPLGARSPHAGGHWLKTLSNLDQLFVHFASATDPTAAERAMVNAFCRGVSERTKAQLHDPDRALPFANLEWPGTGRKRHGVTGFKAPRRGAAQGTTPTRLQTATRRRSSSRPTLHAELLRILTKNGNRWMTTLALADAVNEAGLYRKRDGFCP